MQLIETERFDERLLGQGLGGEDGGRAGWSRLPLRRIEQDDFLDASEFVEEPLHGEAGPRGLRLPIDRLQKRETE